MPQKALGLIEVRGLVTAIGAADAALKAANVRLIGYETAKGSGGMVLIKIEGEVEAVNAAVEAARARAEQIREVIGVQVIPRPAQGLAKLVRSAETVGLSCAEP